MGSLVPKAVSDQSTMTPYLVSKAARLQRRVEFQVFRHGLLAAARAECDRQDGQAVADAVRASLDEELNLLDWGMWKADGSAAKAELVARRVNQLAGINDTRLTRTYGR